MKTYDSLTTPSDDASALVTWERLVTDAVGRVIEFWGFKRNHGRTWALLYLRADRMSVDDLMDELDLSRGAVSMITDDLEQWGVVRETRVAGSRAAHYLAERDFLAMVRRVVRDRELMLVDDVRTRLEEALDRAEADGAPETSIQRIRKMYRLADFAQNALELFLNRGQFDVRDAEGLL